MPGGGAAGGGSVPTGGPGGRSPGGPTGPGAQSVDLSTWDFWWAFNKDQYLNLKAAIYDEPTTGSADFLLAPSGTAAPRERLKPSEESIRRRIVPALKEALATERANDIVTGCLIALAKIGDTPSESGASELEPLLVPFLSDGNQEIAETAAVALGILADDASVQTLAELAFDKPEGRRKVGNKEVHFRTRAFATYGLGLIGRRTASDPVRQDIAGLLMDLLRKSESSTRDVQVAALIALGLVPIDVDLSESRGGKQNDASSRQTELAFVEKVFQDESRSPLIRAHAPAAMARLLRGAPPELKDGVARLLLSALPRSSKAPVEIQQACALALGQVGDADKDKIDVEIRSALRRVAEEGRDEQSQHFALISLGQVGGRAGSSGGDEQGVRECCDGLLDGLTKGKQHVRTWAGLGLGVLERALSDDGRASPLISMTTRDALRTALADSTDPSRMGAYAIACGIARDPDAKPRLLEKFESVPGEEVKGQMAVALGLVGARDAVKTIEDVVKASKYKPALLKQAAIALGLLGDKALVPELVKMLGEAKGFSSQAAISSALGFIGDYRSIDPLVEMLRGKNLTASARGFAAVALGMVADKEPLPWNSKISTDIDYRANTTTLTSPEATGILDIL
jgi:HEAT repeat protein